MQKNAVYPGSFNPITLGHLDILAQASRVFDKIHVMVGFNSAKPSPLFTPEECIDMIGQSIGEYNDMVSPEDQIVCPVEIRKHSGLTARFMEAHNARHYVRGLRLGSEFDAELAVVDRSRKEYLAFQAHFLMSSRLEFQSISSSMVRELAFHGSSQIYEMVTPFVAKKLEEKFPRPA